MNPSNFDELTKALASSTSRRQALRTILGASIGGLLGIGGITTAFGRHHRPGKITAPSGPKGNRNCAKWCAQVFGPNTSAAGQCTSQAAHGTGLCSTCGNVAPSSICCVRTSGYCNGTSVAACCASGQHCCSGTCSECCADTDCTNGNTCGSNNTCVCGSGAACTGICCQGNAPTAICCASGKVCLSNGTCASNCDACVGPCGCYVGRDPHLCGTLAGGSCSVDTDCPRGQWCDFDSHECFANC